jgi:hypothetical protein
MSNNIPNGPDVLLDSRQGAAALTYAGFKTAAPTLETLRCRGNGPIFHRYGRRVLYRWGDLLRWAETRLSAPLHSTSEHDAACAAHNNKLQRFAGKSERTTPESGRDSGRHDDAWSPS